MVAAAVVLAAAIPGALIGACGLSLTIIPSWYKYKRQRDEIGPKAETLRCVIRDVEWRKREAMERGEVIHSVVDDWLQRSKTLWDEYSRRFKAPLHSNTKSIDDSSTHIITVSAPSRSGFFSKYCCCCCNTFAEVTNLYSRIDDAITTGRSFKRVSDPQPTDLKKKVDELEKKYETLVGLIKDITRTMETATDKDEGKLGRSQDWVNRSIFLSDELTMVIEEYKSHGDSFSSGCWRCNTIEQVASRSDDVTAEGNSQRIEDRDDVEHSRLNHPSPICQSCSTIEKIENLHSRIDEAITTGRFHFHSVSHPLPSPPIAPMRFATADNFEMTSSAETALGKVMVALRGGDCIVGVHGLPGVGKTTTVNRAVVQALEESLFERVVFLTVSASVDQEKILKKTEECLGITPEADHSLEWRAGVIKRKIMRKTKVLIILDDVWKELDLKDLGIPTERELEVCGSKLVLTTRDVHVCSVMRCKAKIQLEIWSKGESRDFLKKTAGTNFEDSRDFQEISESVADECRGLPLALYVVAKALGDKPVKEWRSSLEHLRKSKPPNQNYDDSVFCSIKLSYDYLNPEAKACFLLCCLFPEDFSIDREELARYAFALGVFSEASSIKEARRDTNTIADKLKESGLLLPAGDRVKMHNVMRDIAIQIASSRSEETIIGEARQVFFVHARKSDGPVDWPSEHTSKACTAISVMSSGLRKLPKNLECPELKTLLLQDNNNLTEISSAFFESINSLRVLNMSKTSATLLPPSIQCLKMLRVLHIDKCKFVDISPLSGLENLAILSFRQSNTIVHLPKDLGELRRLRMLDLTSCQKIERIPPNVLSNMSSLEELYLKGSFAMWHDGTNPETSQNASFLEVVSLDRLTILEVDIKDAKSLQNFIVKEAPNWLKFDICICCDDTTRQWNVQSSTCDDVSTKKLLLDSSMKDFPDWFFEAVSKKIEKLTYADSNRVNLFEEQAKPRLASLRSLIISRSTSGDYLIWDVSDSKPVFQSLEELQIYDTTIKEICEGDLPEGSFESLKSLTVHCCNSMVTTVLSQNFIKRANNLRTFHVYNADAKEVFALLETPDQGQGWLRNLREMKLEKLNELEIVWKGPAQFADLSNLKLVSVIECKKLTNIFSVSILNGLSKLEDLWIEDCDKMEAIVGGSDEEISPETVTLRLPNLKTLCLSKLPKLTKFCSQSSSLVCPVLEYVHIDKCIDFPSTYFNSSKKVHKNDGQHMKALKKRMTQDI